MNNLIKKLLITSISISILTLPSLLLCPRMRFCLLGGADREGFWSALCPFGFKDNVGSFGKADVPVRCVEEGLGAVGMGGEHAVIEVVAHRRYRSRYVRNSTQVETVIQLGGRLVQCHLRADRLADGGFGFRVFARRHLPRVGVKIIQHGVRIRKAAQQNIYFFCSPMPASKE